MDSPTPITILTGFLGSGKTTLILKLLPQLPADYKLALLKNEFGDVAVDSELAGAQSVDGVRELTNGCICCNLVGQLGDALEALRRGVQPDANGTAEVKAARAPGVGVDRIVIETSGSAFPATLAMEVNRLAAETGAYALDGVISVVDAENWAGYEDTSVTAQLQARYTDLIVVNKWEEVGERRLDEVVDRIRDVEIDPPVPIVKSDKGKVDADVLLGVDGALARRLGDGAAANGGGKAHEHDHEHSKEVEVLSILLPYHEEGIDVERLGRMLDSAPKDEVYRIKGIVYASSAPKNSDGEPDTGSEDGGSGKQRRLRYILNWAFGRWNYTLMGPGEPSDPAARLTVVVAPYESNKWKKRIEGEGFVMPLGSGDSSKVKVERVS